MKNIKTITGLVFFTLFLGACGLLKGSDGFNLFSVQDDRELGAQVAQEIDNNPAEYPVLDSAKYPKPYQYLYRMRDKILNSGQVKHKDDFSWRLRIIHDDETLNAFCTPGGYIYIYTGLMKYLDGEDELAGVLGHEMGHADMRHSTRQMTKVYGVDVLLSVIAGDRELIKNVTSSVIGLKFSRTHETEADEASVRYLCPTSYPADAASRFFEKLEEQGTSSPPEWLSTHPSSSNRIQHFKEELKGKNCTGNQHYRAEYQQMLKTLP